MLSAVNSVLAIGGVGGLAIGLAGREILENLFTGLIILSSSPFEVGEEVMFTPSTGPVRATSGPSFPSLFRAHFHIPHHRETSSILPDRGCACALDCVILGVHQQ